MKINQPCYQKAQCRHSRRQNLTRLALLLSFSTIITISKAFLFRVEGPNKVKLLPRSRTFKATRLETEQEAVSSTNNPPPGNNNDNDKHSRYINIPESLRTSTRTSSSKKRKNDFIETIDASTYEADLIESWETDVNLQRGFDWEIEKLRRYYAGLRLLPDGTWVRQDSMFDFLVSRAAIAAKQKKDDKPKPVNLFDVAALMTMNILSSLGLRDAIGLSAVPNAVIQKYEGSFFTFIKGVLGGDLQTLAGGPLFLLLAKYYETYGAVFNLSFGPKSFLIVSDPVMARHILRERTPNDYDKGVLAEILEPIMGKGLIPADPETWKVRRRAIVPAFHRRWLNSMIDLFADCADNLNASLEYNVKTATPVNMEEKFCSITLDIIGKSVFNYEFDSVNKKSPIVGAVYRVLREAEHRSSSFIPYWNLPYANKWMGGQVEFSKDMGMMDDILSNMINDAITTRKEASVEELEERENVDDPSLLRFLVDMRGEDVNSKQLRDDLMTMLIAGHETTAAMLTWSLFELFKGDEGMLKEIQKEVREVLGSKSRPDYDDIVAMKKLRLALIESLRLYPEPPVLIRRARTEDILPQGGSDLPNGVRVLRGTDIFISTWNLHRSSELWENAEQYDPTRWERRFLNKGVKGWDGYNPDKYMNGSSLYPNEIGTDFAFLPFGGGQRKCVGDQFAMMEATVTLSMLLNKYEFSFATHPDDVGMRTGATIHTMNGLNMIVKELPKDECIDPKGWWQDQHLSRGLSVSGRPFDTLEDAAWEMGVNSANRNNKEKDACSTSE